MCINALFLQGKRENFPCVPHELHAIARYLTLYNLNILMIIIIVALYNHIQFIIPAYSDVMPSFKFYFCLQWLYFTVF